MQELVHVLVIVSAYFPEAILHPSTHTSFKLYIPDGHYVVQRIDIVFLIGLLGWQELTHVLVVGSAYKLFVQYITQNNDTSEK